MINQFISFVEGLFPIDPYIAQQAHHAIKQFELKEKEKDNPRPLYNYFLSSPLEYLAQGDIIADLPFELEHPETGEIMELIAPGIIISNTCDSERDPYIVISPLLSMDEMYGNRKKDFSTNLTFNLLYFPDSRFSEYVVDLTIMNSFSRKIVQGYPKLASLNQFGYYLFICKLTVQLMRPEDPPTQRLRVSNY
jgi:hypothetical protein